MADSVVHFEIPAEDVERAQKFYTDAFGWKIEAYPGMEGAYYGATTAETGPDMMPLKPGAINGGLFPKDKPFTGPVITIGVDDVEAALAAVEKAGGKTLQGKQAVGDMGFTGYFTDPEGNIMGLWQNAQMA